MLGHAAPAASAEKEQLIGGSESSRNAASLDATDAVAGQRGRGLRRLRLPRLPRLPRPPRLRLRRGSQELTGVGALFGVAQLVRAESDLPTVLALIARTISAPGAKSLAASALSPVLSSWLQARTTLSGDGGVDPHPARTTTTRSASVSWGRMGGPTNITLVTAGISVGPREP